jgi:hypothetical protein
MFSSPSLYKSNIGHILIRSIFVLPQELNQFSERIFASAMVEFDIYMLALFAKRKDRNAFDQIGNREKMHQVQHNVQISLFVYEKKHSKGSRLQRKEVTIYTLVGELYLHGGSAVKYLRELNCRLGRVLSTLSFESRTHFLDDAPDLRYCVWTQHGQELLN